MFPMDQEDAPQLLDHMGERSRSQVKFTVKNISMLLLKQFDLGN